MDSNTKICKVLWLLAASVLMLSLVFAAGFNADKLLKTITQRWGAQSEQKFRDWQKLVSTTQEISSPDKKLRNVNDFWNRYIQFTEDIDAWGIPDYWETPMEALGYGKGNCHDYAIAKYFTLISAGVDMSQLRLIYAKAQIGGPSGISQAHMVLAFYSTPDAEPVILDNLLGEIRPASRRRDLTPIFSFNGNGVWAGTGSSANSSHLSRWEDLLVRVKAEGFE